MNKNDKIFIAGSAGMVGSAITRKLLSQGYMNLLGSYHSRKPNPDVFSDSPQADIPEGLRLVQVDLLQQAAVERLFKEERPTHVFLAAARVGGIHANNIYPAQFIHDNLVIQTNLIHTAYRTGVERLLFLGSSCIYPKRAPQPLQESCLLSGPLEPTNAPYAIAKIAGIQMCEAYNRQYGTRFMAVMPTNLYGPNDNFDLKNSHVLPALIRKFHEAAANGDRVVSVWGSGTPRREFLHVDDMADACLFVMNLEEKIVAEQFLSYPAPCFVNVGVGVDVTIRELAEIIRDVVGFAGDLTFDTAKPDGTPQKLLDVSKIASLGWRASIGLEAGIAHTYQWYQHAPL